MSDKNTPSDVAKKMQKDIKDNSRTNLFNSIAIAVFGILFLVISIDSCDTNKVLADHATAINQNTEDIGKIGPEVVDLQKKVKDNTDWRSAMETWRVGAENRFANDEQRLSDVERDAKRALGQANWAARRVRCPKGSAQPWPKCLNSDTEPKAEQVPAPSAVAPGSKVKITRTYRVINNS